MTASGIERRQRQELPFGREHAVRGQGVGMGIRVSPIGAERLQRDDAAGADVGAVKDGLEGLQDRGVGRPRRHAKQLAVALEQSAQGAGAEKVQRRWGTGATISLVSFSAKRTGRFAWQLGQKFLVRQENASRCSAWDFGQRIRAKPRCSRPQAENSSTERTTTGRKGPELDSKRPSWDRTSVSKWFSKSS